MVVAPIGSSTAGAWVASVAFTGSARRSSDACINPFTADGACGNPLLDIVTLSLDAKAYQGETARPSYALNSLYFLYPSALIGDLARDVVGVKASDSNDVKMTKIARWVQRRIRYREDIENYGYDEFWAPPVFTLQRGSGDCEDGAFLIASLALNAGVPYTRLRMYGGEVRAGAGAETGGHGWVGYLRESDNAWIPVDFSYYPDPSIATITPMADDERYIDDYFYMTVFEFVETPGTNRVRDPDGYQSMARMQSRLWIGNFINNFV